MSGRLLLTAEEMRAADRAAMTRFLISEDVLIENAALSLLRECPDVRSARIVVGSGNNGADGYALARHLYNRGTEVKILTLCEADHPNARIAKAMGIPVLRWNEAENDSAGLYVDALFGTGLSRAVTGEAAELVAYMNGQSGYKLAVDIPSGIDADTGAVLGTAFRADKTVTFGFDKRGLWQYPGHEYAGKIVVSDISLPRAVRPDSRCYLTESVTLPVRGADTNKGSFGKLLCVCGSYGMAGAAYMSAKTALKSGCGLVTLALPGCILPQVASRLTEAMTVPLPDNGKTVEKEARAVIDELSEKADVLLIGCGMRNTEVCSYIVKEAVRRFAPRPVVIDADGLNVLQNDKDVLEKTVITPHPGEMARLLGTDIASVQKDRIGTAKAFSSRYGCTVVLKGALTVTAYPDGRVFVNTTGNPGMASGGSGDVLAGLTASLLSQKIEDAPHKAAFIHGLAGDLAAEKYSENAMSASDLIRMMPRAIKKCMNAGNYEQNRNGQEKSS